MAITTTLTSDADAVSSVDNPSFGAAAVVVTIGLVVVTMGLVVVTMGLVLLLSVTFTATRLSMPS